MENNRRDNGQDKDDPRSHPVVLPVRNGRVDVQLCRYREAFE